VVGLTRAFMYARIAMLNRTATIYLYGRFATVHTSSSYLRWGVEMRIYVFLVPKYIFQSELDPNGQLSWDFNSSAPRLHWSDWAFVHSSEFTNAGV